MRDDHAADAPHGDGTPRRRFSSRVRRCWPQASRSASGCPTRRPPAARERRSASGRRRIRTERVGARAARRHDQARRAQARFGHWHAHRARGGGGRGADVDPFRVDVITPEDPFFADYLHPPESVLDRRQHECRDGVRPAASSGRDRACDARRSGGASMGRARFCVHDGRRRRAACVERPPGDVRRARAGGRAVAGAEAGRAERSRAVPLHRQAAQKRGAAQKADGFRTASTCRCRGCWSRSSRVRR